MKRRDYLEYIGKTFERLKVIDVIRKSSKAYFVCECSCGCGNNKEYLVSHVLSGHTKSCGCIALERIAKEKISTKHGLCNTRLHNIWTSMKKRCYKSYSKNYKRYGERGITICDEWINDFQAFYDWCMENGYREDLDEKGRNKFSIDRIDNSKGYSPDNCRFATVSQQARNRDISPRNSTGANGVGWDGTRNKYVVHIYSNGQSHYLGRYNTIEEAAAARKAGEATYWT